MENTQQKINTSLSIIQHLTSNLNIVNIEMRQIPSTATDALEYQMARLKTLDSFAEKLIELANEVGDYANNWDMCSEEELEFINPMFEFINQDNQ